MNVESLELADLVNSGNCAATDVLLMKLGIIKPQLATFAANVRKQPSPQAPQSTLANDDDGIYKIDNYRQIKPQTPQNGRYGELQPAK